MFFADKAEGGIVAEAFNSWTIYLRKSHNCINIKLSLLQALCCELGEKSHLQSSKIQRQKEEILSTAVKISRAYHDQAVDALKKFLYMKGCLKGQAYFKQSRDPEKKKGSHLCSAYRKVQRILEAVGNLKHQLLLMLIYSAGLRVGEVTCLKVEDINIAIEC